MVPQGVNTIAVGYARGMGVMNKRNALLGWVVWTTTKQMAKKKAKTAVSSDVLALAEARAPSRPASPPWAALCGSFAGDPTPTTRADLRSLRQVRRPDFRDSAKSENFLRGVTVLNRLTITLVEGLLLLAGALAWRFLPRPEPETDP